MERRNNKVATLIESLGELQPIVEFQFGINSRLTYFKEGMLAKLERVKYVGSDVYQIYFNASKFQTNNALHENVPIDRTFYLGYEIVADDFLLYPSAANNFTVAICVDSKKQDLNDLFHVMKFTNGNDDSSMSDL